VHLQLAPVRLDERGERGSVVDGARHVTPVTTIMAGHSLI
jgi:hypothetical protein